MSTYETLPVTAAAYHALELERQSLRREKSRFAEQLRLARDFGESSNNDEYLAIREEEALVDARLGRLEDTLGRATIVESRSVDDGTVALGSSVTVRDLDADETFDYVIDSAHAPVVPNAVSVVSPVGRALLGRQAGAIVTVELPRTGRTRRLEVLAVRSHAP